MKKTPVTIAAMLFFATVALSQNNLVYADLMAKGLISYETYFAGPSVGFESILKNKTTIGVKTGLLFSSKGYDAAGFLLLKERLLVVQPEIKFYTKEAHQGFFWGVHASYHSYDQKLKDERDDTVTRAMATEIRNSFFGFGADLGFATAINDRLTFGISGSVDLLPSISIFEDGDIGIGLDARIGYRF